MHTMFSFRTQKFLVLFALFFSVNLYADLFDKDTLDGSLLDNATQKGPLGLYPVDQNGCKDHVLDFTEGKAIPYFWSTCYEKVQEGCCVGESSPINVAKYKLGLMKLASCKNVHKGRFCQSTAKGEISVGIKDDICFLSDSGRLNSVCKHEVAPGDTLTLTMHNNGCTGETSWNKPVSEINGNLQAAMPIKHYSNGKLSYGASDYKTDTTVEYVVPEGACEGGQTGARDQFNFGTDGKWLQVTFPLNARRMTISHKRLC